MLEFARDYFPVLVLILLLIMVLLQLLLAMYLPSASALMVISNQVLGIERRLQTSISLLESIQQSADCVLRENSDLHAIAAHFVPHRRTKQDVSKMYYYEEERGCGADVESEFYRNLDDLKSQSEPGKSST